MARRKKLNPVKPRADAWRDDWRAPDDGGLWLASICTVARYVLARPRPHDVNGPLITSLNKLLQQARAELAHELEEDGK